MGSDPGHPCARDDIDIEGSTTQGNVHDSNEFEYRSENTVTIDRTEKATDRTTVTKFQCDSLHPDMRSTKAVSTTDLMQMLTQSNAHAVMPSVEDLWKSPDGQIYEEEIYRPGERSGTPCSQAI